MERAFMSFQHVFRDPPATYRPTPFWFWNGKMDEEEIVHQIKEMAEKGIGGFFICARQGLGIPYLSEQWFQLVAVAVEAAQLYGLQVWLYDEYPYPSGMSGGEVTLQHPNAKQRQLLHRALTISGQQTLSYDLPWARVLIARATPIDEATGAMLWSNAFDLESYIGSVPAEAVFQSTGLTKYTNKRFFTASPHKRLLWDVPPGNWAITIFLDQEIDDFKYFGTYVDPCHREAMQTFIATTHEQYARRFHEHFGETIKGIFTDEVGLLGRIPWSARLPDFFHEHYDYELVENLPALLYPNNTIGTGPASAAPVRAGQRVSEFGQEQALSLRYLREKKSTQVRYDFFQSLHQLLRHVYHQQMHDWCERNSLQYMTEVPSMRMTTQLYSHVPGGDSGHEKVGRSLEWIIDCNAYNLRANPKIVSSLAHQLGSERAMIECFHSVGWSMTLQDAKWMIDRLAALGINFFVFHAFFYSISGLRKHDAAPSQFLQNPYWAYFKHLTDYAGRLSYIMSQGRPYAPVAIIHPTTSFWTHMGNPFHSFSYCGNDAAEEQALERLKQDWAYLCKQLLLHQIDYDHLDPELLAQATIEERQLIIGQARYEVLILPPMTNLEAAAWSQVKAFLQAGGKVISVGLLPYEQIDQQQQIETEMLQWFGLTTSPHQQYWQASNENIADNVATQQQTAESHYIQGKYAAYFIPTVAGSEHEYVFTHLLALLQQCIPQTMMLETVIGDRKSFLMHQRSLPDKSQLIFITHQEGAEKTLRLHLAQRPAGQIVERWDVASGQITTIPAEKTADGWTIFLSFAPYESHLLHYSSGEKPQEIDTISTTTQPQKPWILSLDIQQSWKLTTEQNNVVRLGAFRFALDRENVGSGLDWHTGQAGQQWPVVDAKPLINQCADIAATQELPIQFTQTFGVPMHSAIAYPLHCWYQTTFFIEHVPSACNFIMNDDAISGKYTLYLNGHKITSQDFTPVSPHGYQQQGCIIQPLLQQGFNHLVVHIEAQRNEDGIRDPLYLSGPFGVSIGTNGVPTIGKAPETGRPKSGIQEGYPYFAGTFHFSHNSFIETLPGEKIFELALQGWDQYVRDCVEVLVNDHTLGVCCWSPYCWRGECALLQEGQNSIEIRLTNTLSGMLEGSYFDENSHRVVSLDTFS
jgi:hypothetical protein